MAALHSAATSTACALTTALTARESVFANTGRSTRNATRSVRSTSTRSRWTGDAGHAERIRVRAVA